MTIKKKSVKAVFEQQVGFYVEISPGTSGYSVRVYSVVDSSEAGVHFFTTGEEACEFAKRYAP